ALAPDKIRKCFYKLSAPADLKRGDLFDAGNIVIGATLEETHENQFQVVAKLLGDGKKVIVLGGGNDISYPDCKAMAKMYKNYVALNIDSHFDVRQTKERNSGTPYRLLLEEQLLDPKSFFELASQPFANSTVYGDYLKKKRVTVLSLKKFRKRGIEKSLKAILSKKNAPGIFWGIDMDSVRSADAPGVSASYPTGLTAEEILSLAVIAGGDKRTKIMEISEVNPMFDLDNRTCKLAALIIYKFLEGKN
ncbi:MAG: formimidoylglutamase, partial [Candidatus Zixiibacteriota bacterium]